jgi:flagellin-like hook-associated protein FlgL
MTRVPTYMSRQVLMSRMQDVQSRLYDSQTQVNTEKKSQTYSGISDDTFRLINFENQRDRLNRYTANNQVANIRVSAMSNSIDATQKSLIEFKSLLMDFSSRDYNDMSPEDTQALSDIRSQSFTAMKDVQYYMNVSVDGRYLFSGGRTDVAPVNLPWSNVDEFAQVFDGTNVTYPETRAADLVDSKFMGRTITPTNETIGGVSYGGIADTSGVASQTFISGNPLTSASFGKLTINPTLSGDPSQGSFVSDQPNSFSGLSVGMTFLFDDNNSVQDTGGAAVVDRQSGVYTITGISADGKTINVEPPPPGTGGLAAQVPNTASAEIRLTMPEGSRITMVNSAGQDEDYTVHWPTNADLTAAGYNLTTDIIDGKRLFVTPPFDVTSTNYGVSQTNINVTSSSYYKGDTLETVHRVDETRSITLGVNALDPAIEKAMRGLGMMAQGVQMDSVDPTKVDATEMRRRVTEALDLINDALQHNSSSSESPGDLTAIGYKLGSNQKVLSNAADDAATFKLFLENRMTDMENVNMLDAVTRLNDDAQALEISYSALAKIANLSLANYI